MARCGSVCLETDRLHREAMDNSGETPAPLLPRPLMRLAVQRDPCLYWITVPIGSSYKRPTIPVIISISMAHGLSCTFLCVFTNTPLRATLAVPCLAGCDCLQLSTPADSIYYHIEGDFCHGNSGRILCRVLERCGIWNCRIGDFNCPRHEYNKLVIPYGGTGDCQSAGGVLRPGLAVIVVAVASLLWAFMAP
jgi:hypothetical protein